MPTFDVTLPAEAPEWASLMVNQFASQLAKCFDGISEQMDDLGGKIEALRAAVKHEIVAVKSEIIEVRKIACDARDLAESNATAIASLHKHLFNVERKCNGLAAKNKRLIEAQEAQESYSRKDNLVIRGIDEQEAETEEMCVTAVKAVFIDKFDINDACVKNLKIVRCHRLGNRDTTGNYNRPIIVRFLNYNDRQMIWAKRMSLAGSTISISENFASNVEHRRKLLYPILKKSKKSPKYTKSYLKGDKLMVDNTEYSLSDAKSPAFPADLDPIQFSTKSNGSWVIFGGPHSIFNPLSNYYPEPVIHKDIAHETLEHAYQYAKASRYQDTVAEEQILCASTPAEAKQIGYHVRNFDRDDWDKVKTDVMLELLRIKFSTGSKMAKLLQDTSGKSLAEAGRSKSFGIGMSLWNKNIFDTSKWPKNCNILGKCLMEVRRELNQGE